MPWLRYATLLLVGPGLLGLLGAYAGGKVGALIGIGVGLLGAFAIVGWSLRR